MLAAAGRHLTDRQQTDTLTAHFEFVNRTAPGAAIVIVEDVKLGRNVSTLHLTLWQGDGLLSQRPWVTPGLSRRMILAYTTRINLRTFTGISLSSGWEPMARRLSLPVPDLDRLLQDGSWEGWEEACVPRPWTKLLASLGRWRFFLPHRESGIPGMLNMWVCFSNGEPITQSTLPYLADSFPADMHLSLIDPASDYPQGLYLPTVVLDLEYKMPLPEQGVRWLNTRCLSKQIKNGRFDLDVEIRDRDGRLIALGHHVSMIMEMWRNTGKSSL